VTTLWLQFLSALPVFELASPFASQSRASGRFEQRRQAALQTQSLAGVPFEPASSPAPLQAMSPPQRSQRPASPPAA